MKYNPLIFTLKNDVTELKKISLYLEKFSGSQGLAKKTLFEITLCIDEHVTNIITHGYHDNDEHWIQITLSRKENRLIVRIEDDGHFYNPMDAAVPALEGPLEKRKIGGLGIYLARHYMDDMTYERLGASNVVVMTKNLQSRGK
jgi:serine/threonine-protein kinase RsbW